MDTPNNITIGLYYRFRCFLARRLFIKFSREEFSQRRRGHGGTEEEKRRGEEGRR